MNIDAILALYPPTARPIGPTRPMGNAGGHSGASLWRYDAGLGPLVARAWPADGPDLGDAGVIHGWLARARHLPFVAAPIAATDGRTAVMASGRVWEIAPWLEGRPVAAPSPEALRDGLRGLAAFHLALGGLATRGPSPGLTARLAELESLSAARGGRLDRALSGASGPLADLARRWLDGARAAAPAVADEIRPLAIAPTRLQPALRDARAEHLLFVGDRLAGLVDYAAMGVESVAADLARLLAGWPTADRPAALDAYAAVGTLSVDDLARVSAFGRSAAILGGGRWAIWHFVEGRHFEDPGAVACGLAAGLSRLESTLADG